MTTNSRSEPPAVVLTYEQYKIIEEALWEGLSFDGGHHKQACLADAAVALGMDLGEIDDAYQ